MKNVGARTARLQVFQGQNFRPWTYFQINSASFRLDAGFSTDHVPIKAVNLVILLSLQDI